MDQCVKLFLCTSIHEISDIDIVHPLKVFFFFPRVKLTQKGTKYYKTDRQANRQSNFYFIPNKHLNPHELDSNLRDSFFTLILFSVALILFLFLFIYFHLFRLYERKKIEYNFILFGLSFRTN